MALYQSYTWVDTGVFINDFKAFAEGNGWTIAAYTAGNSVEISKGPARFKMSYASPISVNLYGYDAVAGWNSTILREINETPYVFLSAGNSIYLARTYLGNTYVGGFAYVSDRIGNWTSGGCSVSGGSLSYPQYLFGQNQSADYGATLAINGAWTPKNTGANGLYTNLAVGYYKPSTPYSNSLLLGKYPLFVRNTSSPELLHPVGFIPNMYNANVWDNRFYNNHDTFTIGADTYYIIDNYGGNPCIIKLEA